MNLDHIKSHIDLANKVIAAEREECARIAENIGALYGEPAIGAAIAREIRNQTKVESE